MRSPSGPSPCRRSKRRPSRPSLASATLPRTAPVSSEVRERIRRRIAELYTEVGTSSHRVASDSHELGWIIRRTCEYLEYYADDELKAAVIHHLRGIGAVEVDELLRRLKATAVRVEVRHFDGYTALQDLIRNPRRSGASLIMREITQVHTGKARRFAQLVRNLLLAAQYLGPEASAESPRPGGCLYLGAPGAAVPPVRGRPRRPRTRSARPGRRARQGVPRPADVEQDPRHRGPASARQP